MCPLCLCQSGRSTDVLTVPHRPVHNKVASQTTIRQLPGTPPASGRNLTPNDWHIKHDHMPLTLCRPVLLTHSPVTVINRPWRVQRHLPM